MLEFKTERQRIEFKDPRLDPRLRVIAFAVDGFSVYYFNKNQVVTEIKRSRQETIRLYKDRGITDEEEIPFSTHEVWRALDLRSWIFTKEELRLQCKFLNKRFEYTGKHNTSIIHKVGDGVFHFHIQVDWDGETIIKGI